MAAGFKTATVNASDVPATQTNFPAYVDLSRLGITTQAEADSVRVYADSGKTTQWAREIVSVSEMWVKIPSLTSTTAIYVDWDGTSADYAATDTYGRNAVWTDYEAVYHMGDTTDSTGNGYTLTNSNSVTFNSGKIGNSANFGSTDANRSLSNTNTTLTRGTGNLRISMWVKYTATPNLSVPVSIYGQASSGARFSMLDYRASPSNRYVLWTGSTGGSENQWVRTETLNTWYHISWQYNSSLTRYQFLHETILRASISKGTSNPTSDFLVFGNWGVAGGRQLRGEIDEARVMSSLPSGDWDTTEYQNQSDEAGFWGTWSTVGGTATPSTLMMMGVGT